VNARGKPAKAKAWQAGAGFRTRRSGQPGEPCLLRRQASFLGFDRWLRPNL